MQFELELGCTNRKIQDDFCVNQLEIKKFIYIKDVSSLELGYTSTPTKSFSGHKVISHHSLKCVIYVERKHQLLVKGGQQENIGMCLGFGPYSCILSEHLQPCGVK